MVPPLRSPTLPGQDSQGHMLNLSDSADGVFVDLQGGILPFGTDPSTPGMIRHVGGSGFDDLISGDGAANRILGNAGLDLLRGGNGDDTIDGNRDADLILGGAGSDVISGGSGDDAIYGEAGNDALLGARGRDLLDGGAGSDRLWGGAGQDTLVGGAGRDVFVAKPGDGSEADVIADFTAGKDRMDLTAFQVDHASFADTAEGLLVSVTVGDALVPVFLVAGVHSAQALGAHGITF